MKKYCIALLFLAIALNSRAQEFGLSFSYFLPKNGEFSTPISPFSIRGLGFNITNFLALETGASLYRMSGMNLKDLPFESKKSLVGPNFTILVPVELVIELKGSRVQFDIKGGAFGFYGFDQRINYGNMDRAIRAYEGWQVANSQLKFENKPGFGFHTGAELTVYINDQFGISLEGNYLMGESKFPLKGTYVGGNDGSFEIVDVGDSFDDAKIDFMGLEVSIGLIFNSGGGGQPRGGAKRRRR
ncbi:hypothetical protein [Pseudochryseolinea flava]|uniref:Outer membrane protein beta-barrel domain-containing protein n=1 Tax=Pseudochryseolinea flava TaxID=2059302 RepID=A0A364Y3S8_9BACT|nr:hypothetical protein [Pseudochryseolinea flava]RAW01436.1 hypothetical protein DQQ10_11080 [Pseudochryseolinea flava]